MLRLVSVLAAGLVSGALHASSSLHAAAYVNDSRSHGKLGDGFLSLNEAIQLHNQKLAWSDLSTAEQAQLTDRSDVTWAVLDPKVTATITLERDLDPIANNAHGLLVGSRQGEVRIELGTTGGFVVDSDFCDFKNVRLVGGTHGIRLSQDDPTYGTILTNVVFEGQSRVGLDVTLLQDDGWTLLELLGCTFSDIPTAIRIDDVGRVRSGRVRLDDVEVHGGDQGLTMTLGPGGGTYDVSLRGVRTVGTTQAIEFSRPAASGRGLKLLADDVGIAGAEHGLVVAAHPTATTRLTLRLSEIAADRALQAGALDAKLECELQDSRIRGAVTLLAKQGTLRVDASRTRDGAMTVGTMSTPPLLSRVLLERVDLASAGASAVVLDECNALAGTWTGSATAPLTGTRCSLVATDVRAFVENSQPLAQPHLGIMDASFDAARNRLVLTHACPAGSFGLHVLGVAADDPATIGPHRFYGSLATLTILPNALIGVGSIAISVPRTPELQGLQLCTQTLFATTSPGPSPAMAPGRRVTIH